MAQGAEGIRRGSPTAFWNAANVKAPSDPLSISRYVQIGRGQNMFCLFVKSSVTAAFKLQTAHVGAFTTEGVIPDPDDEAFAWHDLWYLSTGSNGSQIVVGGTSAWSIAVLVPDFEVDWVRLVRTDAGADATVTAGFESWGD